MSELKATYAYTSEEIETISCHAEGNEYYLKSEADKVIAELKDKLQKESGLVKETRELLLESQKMHKRCADNAMKIIRHANYKRCIDMVKYCDMGLTCYNEKLDSFSCKRAEFFYRWYYRWWKIAQQFKEA